MKNIKYKMTLYEFLRILLTIVQIAVTLAIPFILNK